MFPYHPGSDLGGGLRHRLDQLHATLEALAIRLRQRVAAAIGRALGSLVRDAVLHALDALAAVPSNPKIPPPGLAHRPSDFMPDLLDDGDPDDDWAADDDPFEEPAPSPASSVPSRRAPRWAVALATALRAAGWLAAGAAAVLVGGVSYLCPFLTAAALTLLSTAQQLGLLAASVQATLI